MGGRDKKEEHLIFQAWELSFDSDSDFFIVVHDSQERMVHGIAPAVLRQSFKRNQPKPQKVYFTSQAGNLS